MFKNPGKKLKIFALVLFIIECVAASITFLGAIGYAIIMFVEAVLFDSFLIAGGSVLYAFLAMVIALLTVLVAWLLTLCLYGFGQMIESTQNTEQLLRDHLERYEHGNGGESAPYTNHAEYDETVENTEEFENDFPSNATYYPPEHIS